MPVRNVLLMLSSHEPPPPREEVAWHANTSTQEGVTYLVTTKVLTNLVPGQSTVAFYGDVDLAHAYLGRGVFQRYLPLAIGPGGAIEGPGGPILSGHPLYSLLGHPETAKGMIELSHVVVAGHAEALEDLNGTMSSSGLPLRLRHIPPGPSRGCVYFSTENPLPF
jgi:hypothetical protein